MLRSARWITAICLIAMLAISAPKLLPRALLNSARANARAPAGFATALDPTPHGGAGEEKCSRDGNRLQAGPQIVGSEQFKREIGRALTLLQRRDPEGYHLVRQNLRVVEEDPDGFTRYDPTRKTCYISTKTVRQSIEWLASALVHEAVHAAYGPAEAPAYRRQKETLIRLRADRREIDWIDTAFRQRYGKPLPPQ